ncbi:MAG: methionine--tRNA ligase [bacterium]
MNNRYYHKYLSMSNMSKANKFYITTPIYYVNAQPHLGHLYTTVAADVLARYHRLLGDKTFYLTGTDEHGTKIEAQAQSAGLEPQQFVDGVVGEYKSAWQDFNIAFDGFIRTTDSQHIKAVQKALQYMYDQGDIYPGEYEGLYCRGCEQYKSQKDLVDGKCPDHNQEPEVMSEKCYMFKLSKYAPQILKKINSGEFKIRPVERKNEVVSFYKEELRDVAFSRQNVKWGIPLPWDQTQTAYVWADAFLNYLTGIGWIGEAKKAPDFWPAEIELMAKDILRVHATIWPAMLLSLGLPLPKEFFIHGFFLVAGQKMSKTLGNVITPEELKVRYGVDAARYLLMSITPFGHDGDINWEKLDAKFNAELANGIGNLAARVLAMVNKKLGGQVPAKSAVWSELLAKEKQYFEQFDDLALESVGKIISELVGLMDGIIESQKLYQQPADKAAPIFYQLLEAIRHLAWLISPFMPETADKIFDLLGLDLEKETKQSLKEALAWGGLKPDTKIKTGESLFPRLNKK